MSKPQSKIAAALSHSNEQQFFEAISDDDADQIAVLLSSTPTLIDARYDNAEWDEDLQQLADTLLGHDIGPLTPLQYACFQEAESAAIALIKVCTPEQLDAFWGARNTALHLASFLGLHLCVANLLEHGARSFVKNKQGFIPIDCAADDVTRHSFFINRELLEALSQQAHEQQFGSASTSPSSPMKPASIEISPLPAPKVSRSTSPLRLEMKIPRTETSPLSPLRDSPEQMQRLHKRPTSRLAVVSPDEDTSSSSDEDSKKENSTLESPLSLDKKRRIMTSSPQLFSPPQGKAKPAKSSLKSSILPSKPRQKVTFGEDVLFFDLARNGEFTEFQKCIDSGKFLANDCTLSGLTPLHFAAERGDVAMTEYLIRKGADVNVFDDDGWRPIHVAASHGHNDIVQMLFDNGADLGVTAITEESPYDVAETFETRQLLEKLMASSQSF